MVGHPTRSRAERSKGGRAVRLREVLGGGTYSVECLSGGVGVIKADTLEFWVVGVACLYLG